ncbi:FIST C-terminal domain-containing protein [Peptococcaceae bacterium 1198_IL3148]
MFDNCSFYDGNNFCGWDEFLDSLITDDTRGIILLVGEETSFFNYHHIQPILKKHAIPICGAIFPGLIYQNAMVKSGVLGISFNQPMEIKTVENLSSFDGCIFNTADQHTPQTCLVLVDGLAPGVGGFLEKLFACSTQNIKFIGGGAASFKGGPVLFTPNDCWSGGGILIGISSPVGIGVQHGWNVLHGPLVVNASDACYINEINWQPALITYQQVLKKKTKENITPENFLSIAKKYPLGMVKTDNSLVVRDIISLHGQQALRLVGEIPQNSVLTILQGEAQQLIVSAGRAATDAYVDYYTDYGSKAIKGMIVIDCISRALFLEDKILDELAMINDANQGDLPVIGFFSLGEIAAIGDRYLEFYNKTTVIGVG